MTDKKDQHKEKTNNLEEEIERRTKQMEDEDEEALKQTRQKLHSGLTEQKETTKELLRQGEKLENIEDKAESVYEGAKTGRKTTEEILYEGHLIKIPNVFKMIMNFFSYDRKEEEIIDKKIQERKEMKKNRMQNKGEFVDEEEAISTEDAEMEAMLMDMKQMNKEVDIENKEIKKQKLNIKNINRVNKQSERIMDKSVYEMKKV